MGCCFNLLLVSIFFIIQYTTAQSIYRFHLCLGANSSSSTGTGNTFQTNLNHLITSLSSSASNNSITIRNGYYNTTAGQTPDTVYGSFQCRGDVSLDDCKTCVQMGAQDMNTNQRCPSYKQAIIWFNECMFRYSNQYYFSIMQEKPTVYFLSLNNVSNPVEFNQILGDLLRNLVTEALSNSSFATGDKNLTDSTKVYGFVQCSADISSGDCSRCLHRAIAEVPDCCSGKRAGKVITPSCILKFDLDPFFQSTTVSSRPSPRASPPPSTNAQKPNSKGNNSSKLAISIAVPSAILVLVAIAILFFCFWRKKKKAKKFVFVNDEVLTTESLQFNFGTVSTATDNFSEANKLGEGGFGSVYKGTLVDKQEIAVKRLSKNSGQGEQEFKNEVTLVAKLQHRNLVKLVGFSLAGEEKLLIYEYMPNGSLDQILFDSDKCTQLDWERRYRIIGGIARGLVYLHEESRLKIIHRDLKASNILLDKDMNPKIADFGMARLFVLEQTQDSTKRIVGTHGYMAPEYVMYGEYSVKSDVFSFGVLVLEILCGQRNSSFHKSDVARDLLSYAWRHWNNGSDIEILDPTLKDACSRSEVMMCIHVALLCVQENDADRPTMPTVVQMLNNSSVSASHDLPSSPAFFADGTRQITRHPDLNLVRNAEQGSLRNESISEVSTLSVNEISVTELYAR
ncbi:putative receptor-like protein kinase At4g00960 isoform X1 [Papaver somniferum]|uniref:putative receptor-like protein kinase At4g00960 isoform X1 n=1 Tax=Papaver somniferum TaxID=3469 RepID=UPI000E6F50CC|nr:putative receptor-like protein kinase At4g00960 isoform X1 [Papaver somniferum]